MVIGQYRRVRSRLGDGLSRLCPPRRWSGRAPLSRLSRGCPGGKPACRGLGSVSGVGHHWQRGLLVRGPRVRPWAYMELVNVTMIRTHPSVL